MYRVKATKREGKLEVMFEKAVNFIFMCAGMSVQVDAGPHVCTWKLDELSCYSLGSIHLVFEAGSVTGQELDKLSRLADWPSS